jgi:hypothetical protein
MIGFVALAVGFVVVAAMLFVASVRLGMLVGVRLDRAIEARASAAGSGGPETPSPGTVPAGNGAIDGRSGREENRGE